MKVILAILGLTCVLGFTSYPTSPAPENEMSNAYVAVDTGLPTDIVLHEYDIASSPPDLVAESIVYTFINRPDTGYPAAKNSPRTPIDQIEFANLYNEHLSAGYGHYANMHVTGDSSAIDSEGIQPTDNLIASSDDLGAGPMLT